jgi:uncharacterized membrane protein
MSQVKIVRPREWFNRYVVYSILSNGKEITHLSNGQEKTIEIPAYNMIEAKMLWCGSEKFVIKESSDNTTVIRVRANRRTHLVTNIAAPIIVIVNGIINYLHPNNEATGFFMGLLIGLIISMICLLTIWRHKWLKIDLALR